MSTTALAPAGPSTALAVEPPRGFVQLTSLAEALKFAELLVTTQFVPKDYQGKDKVGNAVVAMQMGLEIGLPPLQALQSIAVVNGRPTLWGDGLRAIIQSAPDLEDIQETDDGSAATCSIKRRGRSAVVRTFSMDDAKAAGLAGKQGPWSQYPKRMRQLRAFGFAARDCYADRLKGIQLLEEVQDYQEPEKNVTPRSEPQRASQAEAERANQQATTAAESVATKADERKPGPVQAAAARMDANGATDVLRRVKLLDSAYIPAANGKAERWEVQTDKGTVVVLDESLFKSIETCIDTDHRFALSVKLVKASTGIARIVTQLDADDEEGGAQ